MAEVCLSGHELIAEVDAAQPSNGSVDYWWMGQHSVLLKLNGRVVYIDPYLEPSPARQTPPLVTPEQIRHAELVLCTHDHLDHIDPFAVSGIAKASPQAHFVAPAPHRDRMLSLGVANDRLTTLWPDQVVELGGIRITAIKAKHEFFDEGPTGFPFLGYVLEHGGLAIYHAGDTLVWQGLPQRLGAWDLDLAFLPINGRDAARYRVGCLGNMTFQEAVDLAGETGIRLSVPTHWDMFAMNSEDPTKYEDYLSAKFPESRCRIPRAGEKVSASCQK